MQKNALDHFIRRTFLLRYTVYTSGTHFQSLLPAGVEMVSLPPSFPWKVAYEFPSESSFESFCSLLRQRSISYEPHISKKERWWVRFIEPHDDCSLSMVWGFRVAKVVTLTILLLTAPFQYVLRFIQALFRF